MDGMTIGRGWPGGAWVIVAAVLLSPFPASGAQRTDGAPQCRAAGPLVRLAGLTEASGIAASRRTPGRFWAHNDSGQPVLFALDARGTVTGRMTVPGARVEDWEAIAVGPCPAGSCIHVADIGDNDAERRRITIYRVPEPAATDDELPAADVFHATYPDGAHDAETLLVTPDGRLFVVTKGDTGPVALYAFPRELRARGTVRLERIGAPGASGRLRDGERITDGSISPDGRWVALRSTRSVTFYRAAELLSGTWRDERRLDLASLGEPQGEGVAFGDGTTLYLAGEGGGRSQPGTFARLTCGP